MEAHYLRPCGQQGRKHVLVREKALVDLAEGGRRLRTYPIELGAQTREPRGFPLCVSSRRFMTEQVHVQ